ncbi:Uracil-DNA glycosylase [Penaeus vannamei]|uniref:Uracil-DNA glycosylase n=1 Tax=Penaeus vannamei TaxID=6689 RepID=A0A423SHQ3_PENVA|nr:Uracil-DNA glycosylase [Penaeus vannamei]
MITRLSRLLRKNLIFGPSNNSPPPLFAHRREMATQKLIANFFKPVNKRVSGETQDTQVAKKPKIAEEKENAEEGNNAPGSPTRSSAPELNTCLSPEQKDRMQKNKLKAEIKQTSRKFGALHENIGTSWFSALKTEFSKPYFEKLSLFLDGERKRSTIFPPAEQVYSWTHHCELRDVKVVILGQDPYHGPRQAHGLCFSVQKGVPPPPSNRSQIGACLCVDRGLRRTEKTWRPRNIREITSPRYLGPQDFAIKTEFFLDVWAFSPIRPLLRHRAGSAMDTNVDWPSFDAYRRHREAPSYRGPLPKNRTPYLYVISEPLLSTPHQPRRRDSRYPDKRRARYRLPSRRFLLNMYKELESDIEGFERPSHGHLIGWAKQGVLLLNACLSVRAHNANSHKDQGWEKFTDSVIKAVSDRNKGVVFLLWGSYAQKKAAVVDKKKHHLLNTTHPSPLSAHRGFLGCKHFSKCNEILKKQGKKPIDWNYLPLEM